MSPLSRFRQEFVDKTMPRSLPAIPFPFFTGGWLRSVQFANFVLSTGCTVDIDRTRRGKTRK